ncbi:MAG: hypothetical protein R3286_18340 [Gammaproteobacteria bacterium]|nr:hypothetical protein [Gammaproteobacteria bacterium]
MTPTKRGRLVLVAVFALFFVPVLGAWLLNVLAPHWQPFGRVNEGTLVEPPLRLATTALRGADGAPLAADVFAGHWTLVHLQGSSCDEPCREALERTRQTRLALGDDIARVRRLLVQRPDAAPASPGAADTDLHIAIAPAGWPAGVAMDAHGGSALLLVDPQGYLVLHYPPDVTRRALYADLKRLLRVSKIG